MSLFAGTQVIFVVLSLFLFGSSPSPHEERTIAFSDATLRGDYSFTINGNIQLPSGSPVEINGVALTYFDGEGGLTNTDHIVRNGMTPPVDWRAGTGSYVVHENCTGEAHITNEGSPTLDLYFVVAERGHEIRAVVSDPGANISANGLRVHASY
jgi:hypothetical protein